MMKRLLIFAVCIVLLITTGASAINLNYQNPTDFNSRIAFSNNTLGFCGIPTIISWLPSGTGQNNVVKILMCGNSYGFVLNPSASPMQYSAATLTYSHDGAFVNPSVMLYDSTGTAMQTQSMGSSIGSTRYRYEVKIVGGTPKYYSNGVLVATGAAIPQNPSYIGWGTVTSYGGGSATWQYFDDMVWGQAENMHVLGLPESDNDTFIIYNDLANTANHGLAYGDNGTVLDSNYMEGSWSRGNLSTSLDTQPNESIQLINFDTGVVYATNYTDTAYTGDITIDIYNKLILAGAPMGRYALTIPGSGQYSNAIWYKSNGASVTWSSKTYSTSDTGSVITVVADGSYWNTGAYTYKVAVMDVFGVYHGTNASVTTQTSTVTHTWSTADNPGVYYAVLYATRISDGYEYILGCDYTTLSSYAGFSGYVNDAQIGSTIPGALVNFTQDSTTSNTTSDAAGHYNATGFVTGANIHINANAVGYQPYNFSWTQYAPKTNSLNISLSPNVVSSSGVGIGGVARDNSSYGRPIEGAGVDVWNTSTGTFYMKTTSMTGWYMCDAGALCSLVNYQPYFVRGHKVGYENSTDYSVVTG